MSIADLGWSPWVPQGEWAFGAHPAAALKRLLGPVETVAARWNRLPGRCVDHGSVINRGIEHLDGAREAVASRLVGHGEFDLDRRVALGDGECRIVVAEVVYADSETVRRDAANRNGDAVGAAAQQRHADQAERAERSGAATSARPRAGSISRPHRPMTLVTSGPSGTRITRPGSWQSRVMAERAGAAVVVWRRESRDPSSSCCTDRERPRRDRGVGRFHQVGATRVSRWNSARRVSLPRRPDSSASSKPSLIRVDTRCSVLRCRRIPWSTWVTTSTTGLRGSHSNEPCDFSSRSGWPNRWRRPLMDSSEDLVKFSSSVGGSCQTP